MDADSGLFRRVVRGGFWVFGFSVTQEILAIVRLIVLARLLSPSDFGLAGIGVLVLATLETFSQTGFDSALIQKKDDPRTYLDTAWTVGVLRGIAVFGLLYLIAPYGAAFFRASQARSIIRVLGLALLARSFTSIGVIYFRKDLEFQKQFLWQFAGRLADFVAAVVAALAIRNVWALVIAFLAGETAKLITSYLLHPYRPHLRLDRAKALELFGFGKWLLGLGIIAFLLTQGDNVLVGRVIGATMLGFYQLARRISYVPASEIAHVISAVTFPAYSKLQDNLSRLREAYLMVLEVTAMAALPLAGLILVLTTEITTIFFGAKWLPAAAAIRVLAAWGAIGAISATAEPALIAVGKPRSLTKYQAIQLVILAAAIYPATLHWGIAGTSLAVTLASGLPCYLALRKVAKVTGSGGGSMVRMLVLPGCASFVAASTVLALKRFGPLKATTVAGFTLAVIAYALVYVALVGVLGRRFHYGIGRLLREMMAMSGIGRTRM